MKLQDQVCSLEQSKRLAELGVKQDSIFYHYKFRLNGKMTTHIVPLKTWKGSKYEDTDEIVWALSKEDTNECYSAFTVAELGKMLIMCDNLYFTYSSYNEYLGAWEQYLYVRSTDGEIILDPERIQEGDTEAQARASMLIYLLENKIISVEQVNESLK